MHPDTFIDALHRLERDSDPEPLAALYAAHAVSGNTATSETFDGVDGARSFWSGYRDAFQEIESRFRNVVQSGNVIVLEWTSNAKRSDGTAVEYEGVTVLEVDGERVTRSTAYFDPAPLIGPGARAV